MGQSGEREGFAELTASKVLTSREQPLAVTKIEEAVFRANSGIARNEGFTDR